MNYYLNSPSTMQMNESWHIPRASLGGSSQSGSSSNSSNKSQSNPPTVSKHSRQFHHVEGRSNLGYTIGNLDVVDKQIPGNIYPNSHRKSSAVNKGKNKLNDELNVNGIKRGSRSSQGSTDSNNSSHSASSGSLLLTAANLERFAAIHKNQNELKQLNTIESHQNYNSNIQISQINEEQIQTQVITEGLERNDTFITIDPNLHFVKTKDVDTMSIASSTHFTMVNGIGGPQRKTKSGICSRGHQITVLILSMSMLFLIGILAAVYLLEMRAKEMPQ